MLKVWNWLMKTMASD